MGHYLSTVVQALLLPPGLFILALVGAQFLLRKKDRWLRIALGVLAVSIYLTSITPVAVSMARPLERTFPPLSPDERPDAIVLLGGGARGGALDEQDRRGLSPASVARLLYAARLQGKFGTPMIVTGGDRDSKGFSEASVMRRELIRLGVPPKMIVTEDKAADTYGNAVFTRRAVKRFGFTRVALVTSALHMPRAVATFRAQGLRVVPAPTDFHGEAPITLLDFLPSTSAQAEVGSAMHEYVGRAYYRLLKRAE